MGNMSAWRTSTYSAGNGACVEVGSGGTAVGVRDSALPGSPVLTFSVQAWQAFTADLKAAR